MSQDCTRSALPLVMLLVALADRAGASEQGDHWQGVFGFDNDLFAARDDYYSNGIYVGVGFISNGIHESPLPGSLASLAMSLPGIDVPGRQISCGLSLAQRIFTPEDLSRSDRIEGDLAYSGQLVFNTSIAAEDAYLYRSWTLTLGVTGPASGAEFTQKTGHKWIGSEEPMGWEHQIENEPLIGINHQIRHRLWTSGRGGWNADVIPAASLSLGNLVTSAEVGITVRAGYAVPANYRIPGSLASDPSLGLLAIEPPSDAYYGFLQINTAAIAYNVAWDGNLGNDVAALNYDPINARIVGGLVFQTRHITLTTSATWATIPWDNPSGRTSDIFGGITLDCIL